MGCNLYGVGIDNYKYSRDIYRYLIDVVGLQHTTDKKNFIIKAYINWKLLYWIHKMRSKWNYEVGRLQYIILYKIKPQVKLTPLMSIKQNLMFNLVNCLEDT